MDRQPSNLPPSLRMVPDSGFYIAAALKNGYARSYLTGRGSKFLTYQLFTSEAILLEVQTKLEDRFGFSRPQVVAAIADIRAVTSVIHPRQRLQVVRDPDDDKILECAVEAEGQIVLSFDKDLLDLKQHEGIQIVHPAQLKYSFPAID